MINKKRSVLAKCDCGNEKEYVLNSIRSGNAKSCGCYQLEFAVIAGVKHNLTNEQIYKLWRSLKQRCQNPKATAYDRYGGKGVKVCDEWLDAKVFCEWALENGWEPGLQVDRINNNGNYEPKNCRIVTRQQNSNNRECTKFIEYKGEKRALGEWANIVGIPYNTLKGRIIKGWDIERAFNTTVDQSKNMYRNKHLLKS